MGGIGVNETQVLAALDELIERVAPSDFSALVVALSARLCALALNAAAKSQPQSTAQEPERNLSAKETAARLASRRPISTRTPGASLSHCGLGGVCSSPHAA